MYRWLLFSPSFILYYKKQFLTVISKPLKEKKLYFKVLSNNLYSYRGKKSNDVFFQPFTHPFSVFGINIDNYSLINLFMSPPPPNIQSLLIIIFLVQKKNIIILIHFFTYLSMKRIKFFYISLDEEDFF